MALAVALSFTRLTPAGLDDNAEAPGLTETASIAAQNVITAPRAPCPCPETTENADCKAGVCSAVFLRAAGTTPDRRPAGDLGPPRRDTRSLSFAPEPDPPRPVG